MTILDILIFHANHLLDTMVFKKLWDLAENTRILHDGILEKTLPLMAETFTTKKFLFLSGQKKIFCGKKIRVVKCWGRSGKLNHTFF